jgi:hypothetical protein
MMAVAWPSPPPGGPAASATATPPPLELGGDNDFGGDGGAQGHRSRSPSFRSGGRVVGGRNLVWLVEVVGAADVETPWKAATRAGVHGTTPVAATTWHGSTTTACAGWRGGGHGWSWST